MTPELWKRLKPLYDRALELDERDRAAFIEKECGGDVELKENLVRLVDAAQESTTRDDGPLIPFPDLFQNHRFIPGEILLGRFRIIRLIGSGGMGEVYEAEEIGLERIAIKTIRSGFISSPEALNRFRQEVQLARKITGPQVCRIHGLYDLPASGNRAATLFLTMEYLDGVTLAEKLKQDGPLPLKAALRVALDICEGLRLVHAQGVIHRDLKTSNIMLCGQEGSIRTVLMDFGLARSSSALAPSDEMATAANRVTETAPGMIMGTPAYMAPEQFEGKPVSPATDIYALGVVLYELVTALHPFAAPTATAAASRRAHRPTPPSSINRAVPRHWDQVIKRCTEYEPSDRYQTAEQVAKDLRAAPASLRNLRIDHPWLFRIACAVIVAAVVWAGYSWWKSTEIQHPSETAFTQYGYALALIRQGNYAEAERLLKRLLETDPQYVMAHARLAEAQYDLDFQGSAKNELLIALPEKNRLAQLDSDYLDAIHATVTGKSHQAVEDYKSIRDQLPRAVRSSGDVDLGMAYERDNNAELALAAYSLAAKENPENPAAYMHIGILEHRRLHRKEGDQAFDRAQEIFARQLDSHGNAGNPEGMAELDYERGYAANVYGDSDAAEADLRHAYKDGETIGSMQLQIRALCQLVNAETDSTEADKAVADANQAIQLAFNNQLESWAAEGFVRMAVAQLVQKRRNEAEKSLDSAISILSRNPQPRTEALEKITWASLMIEKGQPEDAIKPAQEASEFYEKNDYVEAAYKAKLTLTRVERNLGHYKEALADGHKLINLANQSGQLELQIQAEETEGSVYERLEQYSSALRYFLNAKDLADKDQTPTGKMLRAYEARHCGQMYRELGNYSDLEPMLALASTDSTLATVITEERIESALSQRQYGSALSVAQKTLAQLGDRDPDAKWEIEQYRLIAEAYLGMKKQAEEALSSMPASSTHKDNAEKSAKDKLVFAEAWLAMGMYQQAYTAAISAESYFSSAGLNDSALRSTCIAAIAAKALKQNADYDAFSKKAIDIKTRLQQDDGPGPFHSYISRHDFQFLMQRASIQEE